MSSNIWEHFPPGQGSPGTPPTLLPSGPCTETTRLRQELEDAHRTLKQWGHSWRHTAQVSGWLVERVCVRVHLPSGPSMDSRSFPLCDLAQSWAAFKADAEESRGHIARLATEAERARQAEEEAQRQASLLQEALESLRSGEDPHLALHQLQLLHRLPLESVLSLQAQLCSCLRAVEQVTIFMQICVPACLSACLSSYLSISRYLYLSICPSIHFFSYLSLSVSIFISNCLFLSVFLSNSIVIHSSISMKPLQHIGKNLLQIVTSSEGPVPWRGAVTKSTLFFFLLTPSGAVVALLKHSFTCLDRSSPLLTKLTFPSLCSRWYTGNRGSAV